MFKRELQRQLNRYGKYLDIIMSFFLVLLIVVPVLTVFNLSPISSPEIKNELPNNVLGVETTNVNELELKLIGGSHTYIQNENLYHQEDNKYLYSSHILIRDKGVYSKPIFSVSVPEGTNINVEFWIADSSKSTTQVGLLLNNVNYVLKDSSGMTYIRNVSLEKSGKYTFSLDLRNNTDVNFPEDIDIYIKIESTISENI